MGSDSSPIKRPLTPVNVEPGDLEQAFNFAQKICAEDNQSGIDFGNLDFPRKMWDRIADCFEGKVAELAFQQFAKRAWGLDLYVDFEIYEGQHSHDFGDDVVLIRQSERIKTASKVDVKATRPGSQWLLVEAHKFWSDLYLAVRVKLPKDIETNSYHMRAVLEESLACEVVGFAERAAIADESGATPQPFFPFHAGERLFANGFLGRVRDEHRSNRRYINACLRNEGPRQIGPKLRAPLNYGLPLIWLSQDWDHLKRKITGE